MKTIDKLNEIFDREANKYKLLKPCGCVYDTLNGAVVEFCEKHQEEHDYMSY